MVKDVPRDDQRIRLQFCRFPQKRLQHLQRIEHAYMHIADLRKREARQISRHSRRYLIAVHHRLVPLPEIPVEPHAKGSRRIDSRMLQEFPSASVKGNIINDQFPRAPQKQCQTNQHAKDELNDNQDGKKHDDLNRKGDIPQVFRPNENSRNHPPIKKEQQSAHQPQDFALRDECRQPIAHSHGQSNQQCGQNKKQKHDFPPSENSPLSTRIVADSTRKSNERLNNHSSQNF